MASPFSGRAGRLAAMWGAGQLNETRDSVLAALSEILPGIQGDMTRAGADIRGGYADALAALRSSFKGVRNNYNAALNEFSGPEYDAIDRGAMLYSDVLGANGQAGQDRALSTFRAGPGYQFQVREATDEAARAANAMGLLQSGNTQQEIADRTRSLADTEFNTWADRLAGQQELMTKVSGARAGIRTGLGDQYASFGDKIAGAYTGRGRDMAALDTGLATFRNSIGQNKAQTLLDIGKEITGIGMGGMQAGQQAASNRWGAIMGGLNLGSQLLGGAFGGGGAGGGGWLGGLSKLFGKG